MKTILMRKAFKLAANMAVGMAVGAVCWVLGGETFTPLAILSGAAASYVLDLYEDIIEPAFAPPRPNNEGRKTVFNPRPVPRPQS